MIDHDTFYEVYFPILCQLARRKYPDKDGWGCQENGFAFDRDDQGRYSVFCYICGAKCILQGDTPQKANQSCMKHGIQHLKDHNLLPFL